MLFIFVAISCLFEISIVIYRKIIGIKLLQRFFNLSYCKKNFKIQFSIKASTATENYKLLQLIVINVIIFYF